MGLCFGRSDLEIVGFTNADFARDADDRKSTSGCVLVWWNSCFLAKQETKLSCKIYYGS
jgi:hypothetical protein